jgi:endogenous inhibitor of DNA gyrase (YacG/DUF329 family)
MAPHRRRCLYCGHPFTAQRRTAKFCSAYCRLENWRSGQVELYVNRLLHDVESSLREVLRR